MERDRTADGAADEHHPGASLVVLLPKFAHRVEQALGVGAHQSGVGVGREAEGDAVAGPGPVEGEGGEAVQCGQLQLRMAGDVEAGGVGAATVDVDQ